MASGMVQEVAARLRTATSVTVLTGSGVAAESGVPSVRAFQTGPWSECDLTDLATPQAFLRNPRRVWEWYAYRRQWLETIEPSESHYALVDMEQLVPQFMLITQNVDGLHWRAGSRDLQEMHGNIGRTRCFECGCHATSWDDDGDLPPICARCGGMLRPDVIWLGEGLPADVLRLAYQASERSQVFLSIGASARVRPAASLPLIAKRAGAFVVEINPEETALALMADAWLCTRAGEVLPELIHTLEGGLKEREEGV